MSSLPEKTPLPTLSRMGWVLEAHPKFDLAMAHWVYSSKRQSDLMPNGVHNLQWLISKNVNDMIGANSAIQTSLTRYLSKYFKEVKVTCEVKLTDPEKSEVMYTIFLQISFIADNKVIDGSRALLTENGKFIKFVNFNNTGESPL